MMMMQFQYNGKTFLNGYWYDEEGNRINDPRIQMRKILKEEEN